jgi:hypothetical protein
MKGSRVFLLLALRGLTILTLSSITPSSQAADDVDRSRVAAGSAVLENVVKASAGANAVSVPCPFAASLLDVYGYEWNLMDFAPLARALAYGKPCVTLPAEAFLIKHVRDSDDGPRGR